MAAIRSPSRGDTGRLGGPASSVLPDRARQVVWLRGEDDLSTAARVAEVLADAAEEGDGDLVVDLSQVEFMDAAIITVLIRRRGLLRAQSRDLLLRDPSWHARRVLDLCGLLELVDPVPPVDVSRLDPCVTVTGVWSRAPLGGRAVQAIPSIGRPLLHSPFARA
jgi:anti-sigma B factor antagonist